MRSSPVHLGPARSEHPGARTSVVDIGRSSLIRVIFLFEVGLFLEVDVTIHSDPAANCQLRPSDVRHLASGEERHDRTDVHTHADATRGSSPRRQPRPPRRHRRPRIHGIRCDGIRGHPTGGSSTAKALVSSRTRPFQEPWSQRCGRSQTARP